MDRYIVKRGLFGNKLVDENGRKLKLKDCSYQVKFCKDNQFYFVDGNGNKTDVFEALDFLSSDVVEAVAVDGTRRDLNLRLGFQSPEYIAKHSYMDYRNGTSQEIYYVDKNGDLFTLSKQKEKQSTGYFLDVENEKNPFLKNDKSSINVKNAEGKYGVIDTKGYVICPFVFESAKIEKTQNKEISEFKTESQYVLANSQGEVVYIGKNGKGIQHNYDNQTKQLLVCDKNRSKSAIFKLNTNTQRMEKQTVLDYNIVKCIFIDSKNYYVTNQNGTYGLVDKQGKEILSSEYKQIEVVKLKSNDYVLKLVDENRRVGVYDLKEEKIIVDVVYTEIDFKESAKVDGKYKFLAKDEQMKWGVVNSDKEVEVPFNYKHNTFSTIHTYREIGNGENISVMEIRDLEDNKMYFNIEQPNIIATEAEAAQVKLYEQSLRNTYEMKNVENKKESTPNRYSEDEKIGAAVFASILTESPVAGIVTYALMDGAEKD